MPINKLASLASSYTNTFLVEILEIDAEKTVSKSNYPYILGKCKYRLLDKSSERTYQAAHFTAAGKLMMNLKTNHRYEITTEVSERGYEEWVSAVELQDNFVFALENNKHVAPDPLEEPNEVGTTPFNNQDIEGALALIRSRRLSKESNNFNDSPNMG